MKRACVLALVLVASHAVTAQEHHHSMPEPAVSTWSWTTDANAFFGYNYQQRPGADLYAWESQNWFMLTGSRKIGTGRLVLDGMFSLEPWTIGTLVYIGQPGQRITTGGSPQLFQTGESYLLTTDGVESRIPLFNTQHPHDLFMGLGAMYQIGHGGINYTFRADLVGSPTLGPTVFMHRESAGDNPQVPLTHHFMDSTHSSTGVVAAGITLRDVTLEASAFRGQEPDEHRADLERPALDSYAGRVSWRRGPWQAQVSGGHLHRPEWFEPFDITRVTASVGFNGTVHDRPLAVTMGWGENREFNGYQNIEDGYLLEWNLQATRSSRLYGRAEMAAKQLFGLGLHPLGFSHPHFNETLGALTLGYIHDLPVAGRMRLGIGGDVTLYRMSPFLEQFYAGSHSYHAFLQWRPARTSTPHVH